ncbi:MAG TPA: succinate dehydrogenase/fumarate reductase iron-sulfur subunit [Candidatus Sulfotelmatobacter sp.]|nr:succinate dehydrogenase/fumarate reductase iron-sulfur subunit [Candidatus Sulfotelmatobacter sp.]
MSENITLEVLRYNPETDQEPYFQTYTVPYHDDWVVLDALNHVKDHIDATLTYRWSCHMAVCGSCGMMINGEPKLGCHAFLRDYKGGAVKIEPLDHFPIERDLVIVQDEFMEKLSSVKPYIISDHEKPVSEGEYLQTPGQLKLFKQYTQCINCLLCYAACPQTMLNESFVGPAALALAHRYNLDSRDCGKDQRAEVVASNEGIWECTFVGACSEVCPKNVDPAAAIQQTKISASVDWFKALLLPGGKK